MITLATLPNATAQQVFDQVAGHLLTQLQASVTHEGCAYRGEEGLKCAAGCLIADEEYNDLFEHIDWGELVHQNLVPGDHSHLIMDLQCVHDSYIVDDWYDQLMAVAMNHRLLFSFVRPEV